VLRFRNLPYADRLETGHLLDIHVVARRATQRKPPSKEDEWVAERYMSAELVEKHKPSRKTKRGRIGMVTTDGPFLEPC